MDATLTLSVFEVILLFFAAIIVGITIHFTIVSRRNLKASMTDKNEINKIRDEWKSRYFNDIEGKDKEVLSLRKELEDIKQQVTTLKEQLTEAEENVTIYSIEADEMRKENKKLLAEMNNSSSGTLAPVFLGESTDYIEQLRETQNGLLQQNEKINLLLGHIDTIKETEEKHRNAVRKNEELTLQLADVKAKLAEKEKEITDIKQKQHLTKEMTSMLDNAYNEFNVLQGKMQKLELQVNSSRMINMEYEDLKEGYQKMSREYEEQKLKLSVLISDNQQLQTQLVETEEKLRESNFQRQQLQKRIAYLEELNSDMQVVSEANKRLEVQLKRIGELESMLNMVSEERDQLIRKTDG